MSTASCGRPGLDDTYRRPITRQHFYRAQTYIGLFDEENTKTRVRVPVELVSDVYDHADQLRETVRRYQQRPGAPASEGAVHKAAARVL